MRPADRDAPAPSPKRRFLRLMASALLGGSAGAALATPARAGPPPGPQEHWMHAQALVLADPEGMELDVLVGGAKRLRGASFSASSLYFPASTLAGPSPFDRRMEAILLRFRSSPGAEITGIRVFDGEALVEEQKDLSLRAPDWTDQRLALSARPALGRGGGVSIQVAFDAIDREILFGAVGYAVSESPRS